ncbi:hypothetical protein SLS63_010512 [Diaporthe eres]|uniref:Uncharacterized protein n=1 Tax=Diaporthe eres TaxID=83184 RepID=A0ABR1NWM2_DIAER
MLTKIWLGCIDSANLNEASFSTLLPHGFELLCSIISSVSNFPDYDGSAMPAAASGTIGDSAEWRLINDLRQVSKRRSGAIPRAPSTIIKRKWLRKLQIDLNLLDSRVRTTFTALDLDVLTQLEDEIPVEDNMSGKASQSSSESDFESTEGSYSDQEYTSSASTAASAEHRGLAPAQPFTPIGSLSDHPSRSQALSYLVELCEFLEQRVNTALSAADLPLLDEPVDYPKLWRLVQSLKSDPMSKEPLYFIPIPGSGCTSFLFNIGNEAASTAHAFDKLPLLGVAMKPEKSDRKLMREEVEYMGRQFQKFSDFVSSLKISPGSLDVLLERPVERLTSSTSSPSFEAFQVFRRQASAAFRAVFSQFGFCTERHKEHKIFLALPECRPTEETSDPPVRFFFTGCFNDDGQLAKAYLLQ